MKRQELLDILKDGKIATVVFVKRTTGEIREMNCMMGVKKHLKGGDKPFDDKEHDLITVFDMQKRAYRSISCEYILEVRAHGKILWKKG